MKTSDGNGNDFLTGIRAVAFALLCAASALPASAQVDGNTGQAGKVKKEYFNDEDLKVEKVPGK
jgi:hypothetical protein